MKLVRYQVLSKVKRHYSIVLISDLHGNSGEDVLSVLHDSKVDIITIVGDFVDSTLKNSPKSLIFLKQCVEVASTFFVLGNHDYLITKEDLYTMKKMGVHVLNDEWEIFNDEIIIGGLTSSFYHKCEKHDPSEHMDLFPNTGWLGKFEKQTKFKILLDHHPENYDVYTKARNINLILSGHNHGGQIRLLGRGLYARNQGLFPKYDGGIYDNRLVVGRGLANTMIVPRLFNPPELVYVDLKPIEKQEVLQ